MLNYLVIGNTSLFKGQTKNNYPNILNIGTSLFPLGIMSLVYDGERRVDLLPLQHIYIGAQKSAAEKLVNFINKYDVLIMPLQDKLRAENAGYFNLLNLIIPKLKCKICLASIGVHPDDVLNVTSERDIKKFKEFFTLIFDRCKTINVRGEYTKNFIVSLGFPEERIKALGCPSMYGFGPQFHVKKNEITPNTPLIVYENVTKPEYLHLDGVNGFFENNIRRFNNWRYIMTRDFEAKSLKSLKETGELQNITGKWWGRVLEKCLEKEKNPYKGFENTIYPLNIISWMDFLKDKEFCLSSRIHGAIMSMLCGIPTLVICLDTRMEELCKVHNIPYVLASDVDNNTNIFKLIKGIDFSQINNGQVERFWEYIKFLNENDVQTIYDNGLPRKNYYIEHLRDKQETNSIISL